MTKWETNIGRKAREAKERLLKKVQRVDTLHSLLQTWEATRPHDPYVKGLKKRFYQAKVQLQNMIGEA